MDIEKRRADGRCSKRRLRMYAQNRTAWNDVNYMRGRNTQKMAALVSRCRHTMPTYWIKKEVGGMSKRRNIWFEIKII